MLLYISQHILSVSHLYGRRKGEKHYKGVLGDYDLDKIIKRVLGIYLGEVYWNEILVICRELYRKHQGIFNVLLYS